jgi:hypothetical protein
MLRGAAIASAAALSLLAACVPPDDGSVGTYATPSVAFQGNAALDLDRGIWGTQPVTPPAGLVMVRQGDIVGRNIEDRAGNPIAWIEYLLVEPATGDARYAVASSNRFPNYVAVPLSAVRIMPTAVVIDGSERTLVLAPKYTLVELDRRYPRTVLTTQVHTGLPPVAPVVGLPPAAPVQPVEPLQLVRRGSVVGMPVIDVSGQPVGHVDAVAAVPATGEVRYAVIAGPTLGLGQYIVVPATTTSMSGGRVVLNGAPGAWWQAPRYRSDQVQMTYGALGTIN